MAEPNRTGAAFAALREHALSYPETREDFPWGELVIKVRDKVFVFLGRPEGGLSLSVKLPGSATFAFDLPYCEPTGYGLGRAGWVTARFRRGGGRAASRCSSGGSTRATGPSRRNGSRPWIGSAAAARPAADAEDARVREAADAREARGRPTGSGRRAGGP